MRLLVVTDINSHPYAEECISFQLINARNIIRIALNELCGRPHLEGASLHSFLTENDGFNEAANNLAQLAIKDCVGLGYSAGGTAIWRAITFGLELRSVYCVSSTRLRDEPSISVPNHVFFGEKDIKKPSNNWLSTVPHSATVFDGVDHDFYLERSSDAKSEIRAKLLKDMQKQTFE